MTALIAVLVFLGIVVYRLNTVETDNKTESFDATQDDIRNDIEKPGIVERYEKQVSDLASVTVEVQPKQLAINEPQTSFSVVFTTHSVELAYDFVKIISLSDNLGNKYKANSWSGGSGGHHLDGELVFPAINPNAKSITLTIQDIAGIDRTFNWQLK